MYAASSAGRLRRSPSLVVCACLLGVGVARPAEAFDIADLPTYREWGAEVAGTIQNEFRRTTSYTYAEGVDLNGDQFGGVNGYSFIWAASVQFRTLNSQWENDPTAYNLRNIIRFSDELYQRYWLDSGDGQNGYVVAPGSLERYYDDNAHMTVALMEAYELTGAPRLLDRAIATHDFVLEGEDDYQGGGIYFREGAFGNKNTISTLQEARGAAMIYQATGEQRFLDDATRLLDWTNSHVQRSDGLYYQDYRETGIDDISNVPLTNGAGMGVLTNLEMYDITGDLAYLQEARRVGYRASRQFQNTTDGRVWGGGYWAFELVDAWVDIYQHDGSLRWLVYASQAIEFLKDNLEDDNGHYGRDWHEVSDPTWPELDDWLLIDQAAVARAYLYTGLAEPPAMPGDYNNDRVVDGANFLAWQRGESPAPLSAGDLQAWQANLGASSGLITTLSVPEPSALWELATLVGLVQAGLRWRAFQR
ncbi:MAG: hypothetical protein KDA44_01300 [Planctomycetales bacterium]|nr:hypothetical protein [Planctomycetales bacterium]